MGMGMSGITVNSNALLTSRTGARVESLQIATLWVTLKSGIRHVGKGGVTVNSYTLPLVALKTGMTSCGQGQDHCK